MRAILRIDNRQYIEDLQSVKRLPCDCCNRRLRDAPTPTQAIALLSSALAHPDHELWADEVSLPVALEPVETALQGDQQLTDAYLLGLAYHREGALATFDRGLRALAAPRLESIVTVVPAQH